MEMSDHDIELRLDCLREAIAAGDHELAQRFYDFVTGAANGTAPATVDGTGGADVSPN